MCSSAPYYQFYEQNECAPINVGVGLSLSLSCSGLGVTFKYYSDNSCKTPLKNVTVTGHSTCSSDEIDSCIAASSSSSSKSSCFAGSETVQMETGDIKLISEVIVGDRVLAADSTGALLYSTVVYLPHQKNDVVTNFVQITTESGRTVKMTPSHLLWVEQCGLSAASGSLMAAGSVQKGVCVRTVSGQERVQTVQEVKARGVYTLVTQEAYVVVSGVVASPFEKNHFVANMYYNLHRMLYSLAPSLMASPTWLVTAQSVLEYGLLALSM